MMLGILFGLFFLLLFIGCVLVFVQRYVRHEVNESKTNRL